MNKRYKIVPDCTRDGFISFNPANISKTAIKNRKISYVRFGIKCCEVKIGTSAEIEVDEILLSLDVIEELKIPLFL